MRIVVPTRPVPNQTLQVQLGQQACVLNIYQTQYGLFVDLYVGNSLIVCGVIAENLTRLVRSRYLGFYGDLAFFDAQASGGDAEDPVYSGLGARFLLMYFEPADLPDEGG